MYIFPLVLVVMICIFIGVIIHFYFGDHSAVVPVKANIKSSLCYEHTINRHLTKYDCLLRIVYIYNGIEYETYLPVVSKHLYGIGDKIPIHIDRRFPIDVSLQQISRETTLFILCICVLCCCVMMAVSYL